MYYNTQLDTSLYHASYAARHAHIWGVYAAARYCLKRGVSAELLIKAIRYVKSH